jgi:hypothetical protein
MGRNVNPIHGCLRLLALLALLSAGCGTTKSRMATEQLLMSDAVDRTVARIDFTPLAGRTVYFDSTYIKTIKGLGFVNADYIISALRQQMLAAGCLLQDEATEAEFVIEGRVGALGTDDHEVTYGMPASSGLHTAASIVPNSPPIPVIPEISVAKKEDLLGAAKIAVFAYHRETRLPIWQSGVAVATNNAKDAWIFGAGPFQFGSIYDGTRFAGSEMRFPLLARKKQEEELSGGFVSYYDEVDFETEVPQLDALRPRTPEEINAAIDSLAEMPKLFPFTDISMDWPKPTAPAEAPPAPAVPPAAAAPAAPKPTGAQETVADRPPSPAPPSDEENPPTIQR